MSRIAGGVSTEGTNARTYTMFAIYHSYNTKLQWRKGKEKNVFKSRTYVHNAIRYFLFFLRIPNKAYYAISCMRVVY